jgi:hypothetical protein
VAKKSTIKIPGKNGPHEAEGVVVWAFVGTRKHKFFLADQGYASQPIVSDWHSGYAVGRLPEAGIYFRKTLRERVNSMITDLIQRTVAEVEAKARKEKRLLMSQAAFDEALIRIYAILDDVPVINGKMTKHHKAALAANTTKAVENIKAIRAAKNATADESRTDLTRKKEKG